MRHAQGRAGECQRWLAPPSKTESENCSERSTGRPRPTPHGDGRMPAVKDVGEPCAGEPHARFEVAAGGNRNQVGYSRAELGASRRPYRRSVLRQTRVDHSPAKDALTRVSSPTTTREELDLSCVNEGAQP